MYRTVTLIPTVPVVFCVNFRSPYICVISFERNHPVIAAENAGRTVIVYKKALRRCCRKYPLLFEVSGFRGITFAKAQIVRGQLMIKRFSFIREVSG